MRESVFSILALLAFSSWVASNEIGKDGFNFYKDYLRGRSDEILPVPSVERMLYFYRTPLQLYPGLLPALEEEYRKRTGNTFKNHMLSKELEQDRQASKRSSKTALSLMMGNKHEPIQNSEKLLNDFIAIPLNLEEQEQNKYLK